MKTYSPICVLACIGLLFGVTAPPANADPISPVSLSASTWAFYGGGETTRNADGGTTDTNVQVMMIHGVRRGSLDVIDQWSIIRGVNTWSPLTGQVTRMESTEALSGQDMVFTSDPLLRKTSLSGTFSYVRRVWTAETDTWVETNGVGTVSVTWTGIGAATRYHYTKVWSLGDVNLITSDGGLLQDKNAMTGSVFGTELPLNGWTVGTDTINVKNLAVTPHPGS